MSKIDKFLDAASYADPFTGLVDWLANYNTIEYQGGESECKQIVKKLREQGIKCRVQVVSDGCQVISKR